MISSSGRGLGVPLPYTPASPLGVLKYFFFSFPRSAWEREELFLRRWRFHLDFAQIHGCAGFDGDFFLREILVFLLKRQGIIQPGNETLNAESSLRIGEHRVGASFVLAKDCDQIATTDLANGVCQRRLLLFAEPWGHLDSRQ